MLSSCTHHAGGSIANCFNDLWWLDLEQGVWTKAEVQGPTPTPRAGHSAALVGNHWYVLGGGNNIKGGLACLPVAAFMSVLQ